MVTNTPRYYAAFRCLAGACPHTCCAAGWEIPVDPDTSVRYQTLSGPLGERIRTFVETDPEGVPCFPLRGESCPFLGQEGLCHIHIQLGEEAPPLICRTHPRFCYDYGPLRERGLCGSCPEAARLILGENMELTAGREPGDGEDLPPLLPPLLKARETALSLLTVENATLSQRLQALLFFANEVQVLLDDGQTEALPQLCEFYEEEFPLLSSENLPPRQEVLKKCLCILEGLSILCPQWQELLSAGKTRLGKPVPLPPHSGERAAAYFLYRHWLRGAWDGDVLSWAEFAVLGTVISAHLSPCHPESFPETFRQFCQELEHSEDNMAAIQNALWDKLSLAEMLSVAAW